MSYGGWVEFEKGNKCSIGRNDYRRNIGNQKPTNFAGGLFDEEARLLMPIEIYCSQDFPNIKSSLMLCEIALLILQYYLFCITLLLQVNSIIVDVKNHSNHCFTARHLFNIYLISA